jgi:soluble lytic murein transglycosylase-like protein
MARSPAHLETLTVVATAAAAWVVLVAVLFRLVPSTAPAAATSVRASPSHRALSAAVWQGAPRVYAELDRRAHGLAPDDRARVARAILEEAERAGVAPLLVLAVIHVESRYDPRAVSPVGARGLMQLMEPTLRGELAGRADPFDPVTNVRAGVRYLGRLIGTFSNVELALVAYNAGPGRVRQHLGSGGVPARLMVYPRDVLREAVRLWPEAADPAPVSPRPAVRVALAAAHRRGAEPAGQLAPATACAAGPTLALFREACVRVEVGLPMTRGRDRARQVVWRAVARA